MENPTWTLLYELSANLERPELGAGDLNMLATDLDAALSSSQRSDLASLVPALEHLYGKMYDLAPPAARIAADAEADPALRAAWNLAKVDFAYQTAAQGLAARADQAYLDLLHDPNYASYLRALAEGDKSNAELVEISGHAEETVSRKLRDLRAAGICDYRRFGKQVINFLTPLAHQLWLAENPLPVPAPAPGFVALLNKTEPRFQRQPSFGEKAVV